MYWGVNVISRLFLSLLKGPINKDYFLKLFIIIILSNRTFLTPGNRPGPNLTKLLGATFDA